jgi:hypothetical protein
MENTLKIPTTRKAFQNYDFCSFKHVSVSGGFMKLSSSTALREARCGTQLRNKADLVEKDWRRSEG